MTLEQIAAWRAVRTEGTTLAAARSLGLSQSAVSRRVSQLEASLGLALFVRDKSALVPTRESAMLEDHLVSLSDRGRGLRNLAGELRAGNSAAVTLRIAVPASLTMSVVPEIVSRFLARNDRTRIELHTGPYDAIERMLHDDRAEIGFLRLPHQSAALSVRPVVEARTVCVLPAGHPLAEQEVVSIPDLRGVPLILLGRRRVPRNEIDRALLDAGLSANVQVEAHSVGSACGLVAASIGVTLVNELMAGDFAHLGIVIRPLAADLTHRFAFAMSSELPVTQAAERFMETGAQVLAGRIPPAR